SEFSLVGGRPFCIVGRNAGAWDIAPQRQIGRRTMMKTMRRSCAAGLIAFAIAAPGAFAQTLKIGLSSEPTAIDPHYHDLTPNNLLSRHIYEALTSTDADLKIQPLLATSWSNRDDRTWVFKLREGVKFSNGAPFTADDVIFSFCRILNNETGIAASFTEAV